MLVSLSIASVVFLWRDFRILLCMGLLDDVGPRSGGSPCRHRRHAGDERLGAQRGVLSRFLPDAGRSGFHGGCHGFAGQISAALWFLAAASVYLFSSQRPSTFP
jgi:hypothetical protein